MRRYRDAADRWTRVALPLLLLGGGPAMVAPAHPPREALTADEAIACLRTAAAAQAGWITEVEGDQEGGKRLCAVELVDEAGNRHTLHVDGQTQQVVTTT